MRILRIILHSFFVLLGVGALNKILIPAEYLNIAINIVYAYTLGIIGFSIIKEIGVFAFPRHMGIAIVYVFLLWEFLTLELSAVQFLVLQRYLLLASVFIVAYHLIVAIINNPYSFKFRKMGTSSFREYYWPVYVIYLMIIIASGYFFYNLNKSQNIDTWHYSLAILLGLFPYYNKNLVRALGVSLLKSLEEYCLKITFNQLGRLSKVKNFVFFKDRLIESGNYQLVDSDYRSTVRVISMLKLSLQLSDDWNKKYSRLFVNDEFGAEKFSYKIVSKNEDGITVIDDKAILYEFGNYKYVKDKIKRDDKANLYLLKNDLPVAKYTVNERINDDKAELVNQIDYFGNTILFNSGTDEDLGRDYEIVFDKIYSNLSETKLNDILTELNKRAPTAFFTSTKPENIKHNLIIYITENPGVKKNGKFLECNQRSLLDIPRIIKQTKKVNLFLRYGLFISLGIQFALLVLAIIFYKHILLILGLNLGFASIAELLLRVFSKRLDSRTNQ